MFPSCEGLAEENAYVESVEVNEKERSIKLEVHFERDPGFSAVNEMKRRIINEYSLSRVDIVYEKAAVVAPASSGADKKENKGPVLWGKEGKTKIVPMNTVTLESGRVAVEGDVIAVESKELGKRAAAVLTFDIADTDYAIRVSKYLSANDDKAIITKIEKGDHLIVYGNTNYDKYYGDLVLDPTGIVKGKKEIRKDEAEEKRVELHLHTRFSTMDALVDPQKLIKRCEYWGMKAVAVTDHGNAQAFPDMWKAIVHSQVKVIYGLECYYVDDVDGFHAVFGRSSLPIDTEYVVFDTETTGLDARNERLTEIGAAVVRGGRVVENEIFNTFVNPEKPIPARITELTGIKDSDVANAPKEAEAVREFIKFVGNRPLIAHNAVFDISFLNAVCDRHRIRYTPVYIDTLAMSKALLPGHKKNSLDAVTERLGLPTFNHHRASDDAIACGKIFEKLITMVYEHGGKSLMDIEHVCHDLNNSSADKSHHMILLAKNKVGLKNLYEIISKSYLNHFHKNPRVPRTVLERYREGLLVGSACGMGELYSAVMRGEPDEKLEKIASFYDYLEIQPIANNGFLIADGRVKDESVLQGYNRKIYDLGKKLGKRVVAASDVHFLDPEEETFRRVLLAGMKYSDADRPCPIYFRTTEEMLKEFEYLGEDIAKEVVVTNTNAIADEIERIELLPKDLFAPKIENSAQILKDLVYNKMHSIYGEKPLEQVQSRVDTELNTILEHEYDVIYMSAQKLVQDSLDHGYLVGSRGSVGSSLVAYMAGITEVNALPAHYVCPKCCYTEFYEGTEYKCGADLPEKACPKCGASLSREGFDIPFETFLGYPGAEKTPDIDLNFSGEYQAKAHKHTEQLFGSDHVFRAGTISTLQDKVAYGYVKKYLEERGKQVTKTEENRLCQGIVGVKKTTGQHPGGLVIIPQDMDVTDFCPVQHPADDVTSNVITTHFEYHCMENNLLKLDELGHDDPTMIRMLEDMTGVNAREISLSDPDTMAIFKSPEVLGIPADDPIIGGTGTIGVPEFGTNFTRQMLIDTQPSTFDTLVRLSGFSHGTDVWAGNIRDLVVNKVATVDETVGCRDDIMITLIAKGMDPSLAFNTMESVRKGKVKKSGAFPDDAEQQMKNLNVPQWWIESCRKIAYLFPKAHAVAYVMMAFRIAWFKVHKPLAFYSAYFYRRSQKGEFDIQLMGGGTDEVRRKINEFRRKEDSLSTNEAVLLVTLEAVYEFNMRGFEFAPLSLYESDATKFIIKDGKLVPPFVSIPGLGENAALDLVNAAKKKTKYISVEELSNDCPKVSKSHLESLKALKALGDLPETSQINLFEEMNL